MTNIGERISLQVNVSPELTKRGLHAGKIASAVGQRLGGKGGGYQTRIGPRWWQEQGRAERSSRHGSTVGQGSSNAMYYLSRLNNVILKLVADQSDN